MCIEICFSGIKCWKSCSYNFISIGGDHLTTEYWNGSLRRDRRSIGPRGLIYFSIYALKVYNYETVEGVWYWFHLFDKGVTDMIFYRIKQNVRIELEELYELKIKGAQAFCLQDHSKDIDTLQYCFNVVLLSSGRAKCYMRTVVIFRY